MGNPSKIVVTAISDPALRRVFEQLVDKVAELEGRLAAVEGELS